MARAVRGTYTEKLPAGARIFTKDGIKCAEFQRRGKTIRARLTKNGKRVLREVDTYYAEHRDVDGRLRWPKGYRDRGMTEKLAHTLEDEAKQIREGLKQPYENQLKRPLMMHLQEFRRSLIAKGTSEKQAQQVYNRITRIIDACKFVKWIDIKATEIENFLADLRKGVNGKRGLSRRSSNGYLGAVKQFCCWMKVEVRAPRNPVQRLKPVNPNGDIRHPRRALSIAQCQKLLKVTEKQPEFYSMSGPERKLLYWMDMLTGLRADEVRTLLIRCCDFDSDKPSVTIEAGYSKTKEARTIPIPLDLARALKKYVVNRPGNGLLFPKLTIHTARMLRQDLEAAGIPYCDENGEYADFHALRHTFGTNLARAGVHPEKAMKLLGHHSIDMTMRYYTHSDIEERRTSIDKLPKLVEDEE